MVFRRHKKVLLAAWLGLLILLWWFFQGYFRGYEINIWYKEKITMAEARELTHSIQADIKSCEKGAAFNTDDVMCDLKVNTNALSAHLLLKKLRAEKEVLRADFLGDLIKEFDD